MNLKQEMAEAVRILAQYPPGTKIKRSGWWWKGARVCQPLKNGAEDSVEENISQLFRYSYMKLDDSRIVRYGKGKKSRLYKSQEGNSERGARVVKQSALIVREGPGSGWVEEEDYVVITITDGSVNNPRVCNLQLASEHQLIDGFFHRKVNKDNVPVYKQVVVMPRKSQSLYQWMEGATAEERLELVPKILCMFLELFDKNLTHGDVKPENIVIDLYGEPSLIDFESLRDMGDTKRVSIRLGEVRGSDLYEAPEIFQFNTYTFAAECYSLGVLLQELLVGSVVKRIPKSLLCGNGRVFGEEVFKRIEEELDDSKKEAFQHYKNLAIKMRCRSVSERHIFSKDDILPADRALLEQNNREAVNDSERWGRVVIRAVKAYQSYHRQNGFSLWHGKTGMQRTSALAAAVKAVMERSEEGSSQAIMTIIKNHFCSSKTANNERSFIRFFLEEVRKEQKKCESAGSTMPFFRVGVQRSDVSNKQSRACLLDKIKAEPPRLAYA